MTQSNKALDSSGQRAYSYVPEPTISDTGIHRIMASKRPTKTPQSKIDEAVKRHLVHGEPVVTLAKEYKVSRPGFYLWLKKAKEDLYEQSRRKDLGDKSYKLGKDHEVRVELEQLRSENAKLRERVIALMIKYGEM